MEVLKEEGPVLGDRKGSLHNVSMSNVDGEGTHHLEQDAIECADWVDQQALHQIFHRYRHPSHCHPSHWLPVENRIVLAPALDESHVVGAGEYVVSDLPLTHRLCCKRGKHKRRVSGGRGGQGSALQET